MAWLGFVVVVVFKDRPETKYATATQRQLYTARHFLSYKSGDWRPEYQLQLVLHPKIAVASPPVYHELIILQIVRCICVRR